MSTTPTNPQPAKTPRCEAFDREANRNAKNPLNMADVYGDLFDFARTLERTLAERDAEVEELRNRLDVANGLQTNYATQLRAAEERAQRAERDAQVANNIKTAEKKILIAEIEAHTATKTRLATVADEIEKTRAVEALKAEMDSTGPNGRVLPWNVSLTRMTEAHSALTALEAKLREDRA